MPAPHDERTRAEALAQQFLAGRVSRRRFLVRAGQFSAVALATTSLGAIVAACSSSASPSASSASTQPGASVAPSATPVPSATPKAGGMLNAALTGNPDSLDPGKASIYTSGQVIGTIFSKLVEMDEKGEHYGVLATKWDNSDPKAWVFDLRDDVTFHNGEKFSATDVKYTFDRILDPNTASPFVPSFEAIDSVEVVSPTRVIFHLKHPLGPFLTRLSGNASIVNQKAIESADPALNPVGTGPFQFVEWVQNDHVAVKKFDGYFDAGKPYLDGVTLKFLPVDQSRVEGLRSGQLDWLDAVPLQSLTSLSQDAAFNYVTNPVAGIPDFLALNCTRAPFNNKALRQAIYWAVDKKQIRDVAYFGAGEIGSQEVPSGSAFYDKEDPYLMSGQNLAMAKQKMQEAGLSNGLSITYLGLPQYPELLKTGEVVRDQLKAIGIDMKIEQLEVTVWLDRYAKHDYDITSGYWAGTVDPDDFYSTNIKSGQPLNTTGYSNTEADQLIDQAAQESDQESRKQLYAQIRQIVWDDAPLVFVHYETINYLMDKTVMGSTVNPPLDLRFDRVWIDK